MSAMEQEIDEIKQEIHDQQMKEQELTFEEKSLKDRLHQAYKINIDEVPQEPLGANRGPSAADGGNSFER